MGHEKYEFGDLKGDVCSRNECRGIIEEHHSESSCSCHISPPCSYCTTAREFCPECGWEASDDDYEYHKQQNDYWNSEAGLKEKAYYQKQQEEWDRKRKEFWDKFRGTDLVDELDYINESHTHFSMKKTGMYPVGKVDDLLEKIKGTFGGRFEMHNPETGRFVYIAYTD